MVVTRTDDMTRMKKGLMPVEQFVQF